MVSATSPSARRRRWLFALPALAILFALSCVVLAWIGYTVRNARIQERAIKDIRDIGGRVYYPYEGEGFEGTTAQLLACAVLGSEYVYTVTQVNLNGTKPTDRDVQRLARLKALVVLNLSHTDISDSALAELHRLDGFQELNLEATPISDAGLEHLGRCDQIRYLWLRGTQISDAGMPYLEQLKRLKRLDIRDTQVSAKGAERIAETLPKAEIYHESRPKTLSRLPKGMQRPLDPPSNVDGR